jgi:anti-anti-sigma factor
MLLTIDERDGVAIVRISDDITQENIPEFAEFFRDQVNPKYDRVVLDMRDVDYFCSSAYGVMLRCLEATRGRGGEMVLANVGESVRRLFEVTRLTSVIALEASEDAALRRVQKRTGPR